MIRKVDFRKGNATFIYGFYIMMLTLLIALVCIEQFSMYNNAFNTQIAADAIADGTAVYMANNEATYEEAMENTNVIKELLEKHMGIKISNIKIDEDELEDNDLVSVELTANYYESSNIDDFYGVGNLKDNYDITRHSATSFSYTNRPNGDYIWPLDNDMNFLTSPFGIRNYAASPIHKGLDIVSSTGVTDNRNIYAIEDGKVVYINAAGDSVLRIYHGEDSMGNHVVSQYVHWWNVAPGIHNGKEVKKGDLIAYVGNATAGTSTGSHLDFKVYFTKNLSTFSIDVFVNPLIYCYGLSADGGNPDSLACELETSKGDSVTSMRFNANYGENKFLLYKYYNSSKGFHNAR